MIYSAAHNCVVYTVPDPQRIAGAIAGARIVNGTMVAVPADLFHLQLVRLLDLPAPPLLEIDGYDYPIEPGRTPYEHQRHMANFHVLHPRAFNLSEMGCVDGETEYLSPTGWRRMDQYVGGKVAQYHPSGGRIEFVEPTEYVKRPCSWMWRFKTTKGLDQKLSPEHRVLWVDGNGNAHVSCADTIAMQHENLSRGWKGRFKTTFAAPDGQGISLSDAQLRLQVAVIADGYFVNRTRSCVVRIKKERKKIRLRQLLVAADVPYRETSPEYKSAIGFSIFKFTAPTHDKVFGPSYWEATAEQRRLIANEVVHWDGSLRKDSADSFYSCEKKSADFIQYCYATNGRTASLQVDSRDGDRDLYTVHARKSAALLYLCGWADAGGKTKTVWQEPTSDGFKYCFMVPTSFLVFRRNGCIFASGNTGKTNAVLWAADYLMRLGAVKRWLVISPLSTLRRVWDDEIFRNFLGKRRAAILHGSRAQRLARLQEPHDFYVINHDGLAIGARRATGRHALELGPIAQAIADREDIGGVIIDEASAYKDGQTLRARVLRKTIGHKPYLWLLSGTPTPNAPTDAWSLGRITGRVTDSFQSFRARTMLQVTSYKWVPKADASAVVNQTLQPAIRYARAECIDLPDCVVETRDVPLSPAQEIAYKEMKKDLVLVTRTGKTITAVNEAVLRLKLIQIACGAVYGPDREVHRTDCGPRVDETMQVIDEAGGKILIFAPLTSVVNLLYSELRERYGEKAVARIYGGTSQGQRSEIFRAFEQESLPRMIVADPQTMSHGLTLVAANTIVWYAPTDKNETYEQANARINRPGQTRKMLIVRIASTPVEHEIYKRLESKSQMQGAILRMAEEDR